MILSLLTYGVYAEESGVVLSDGNFTENFADFSNVYSITNLRQVTNNALLSNELYNDSTIWQLENGKNAAEVVYRFRDSIRINSVYLEFSRDAVMKYPVISWSEDGVTYTDLTARMDVQRGEDEVVLADWKRIMTASEVNGYQHVYSTEKSVPASARYIKFEVQEGSLGSDRTFLRKAVFSGGERTVKGRNVVDDFENFDNVFAFDNVNQVKNNGLLTNTYYNDSNLWTVTDTSKKAEVVFKASEGMLFSQVEFEFSRMTSIKYPVLSYSVDGVNYTDLTTRMTTTEGDSAAVATHWTKLQSGDKNNLGQFSYSTAKTIPEGAKYVKVEIQAGSSVRPIYLKRIAFALGTFNELTSNLTEIFEEFENVYSYDNLKRVENNPILESRAYGDNTLWMVDDTTKSSEIVYAIKGDGEIKSIYFEFSRNSSMIYPVLSYSYDGETYYDLTTRMTAMKDEDDTVKQDWTRLFNAGDENLWQYGYSTKKEIPTGAKFVKIETLANASANPYYFRKAKIEVDSGLRISESITDELGDISKLSGVENFVQTVSNAGLDDASVLCVENVSEIAELIYVSEAGKEFSAVELEIAKRDKIKFPVVAYSTDGKNFENINIPMAIADYDENYDWVYGGSLSSGYDSFSLFSELPQNTRAVKVWMQKNSVSSQNDLMLSKISLSVEKTDGVSEKTTDTCDSFARIYSSSNMSVAVPSEVKARGLDDTTAFGAAELSKKAEVVYKAAEGKEFSEITVELMRQGMLKFPVISYSEDNVTYTDVSPVMDEKAYSCDEWYHNGTVYKPDGTSSYYNRFTLSCYLPKGAKFVKVWLAEDALSKLTDVYIRKVDFCVRNENAYARSMFEEYSEYFDICMAVEPKYLEKYHALISSQANVMVTENGAKSWIHYGENDWDWSSIDASLNYAEENNMKLRAHTLVCPDFFDAYAQNGNTSNTWFFEDENGNSLFDSSGNPVEGARELTLKRLENHIKTVMTKYKGRIYAYDVLNEPYMDRGAWRTYTKFWKLLGTNDDSWINDCFRWAHEADPDAVLILNDNAYTWDKEKETVLYNKIKEMRDAGIPVQLGAQMHYGVDTDLADVESMLKRFSGLCDIYITEHDLKMVSYATSDGTTYEGWNGLQARLDASLRFPDYMYDELCALQARKYASLLDLFRKYSDSIPCVGLWGICDGQSEYTNEMFPLMFDEDGNEKDGYFGAMDFEGKLPRWSPEDGRIKYRRIDYRISEADGTVRIVADANGVEQTVTATLYTTTQGGNVKIFGEPSLKTGEQTTVTDNECSFTFPLDGYNPDDAADTSRYVIKLNMGGEEILDYFYYIPSSAYSAGLTIVDDFNDFEKEYEVKQLDIVSNLTLYDDDFSGFVASTPFQTRDKYVEYRLPDGHQLDNITLDAYVYKTYKNTRRPVISVSANGTDYTAVSSLADWPASSEITDKVYPNQYGSENRSHFRCNISEIPSGMKYLRIDVNEFTGQDQIYLSKLRIETALNGTERVYSLKVDSNGKARVFGINGTEDKGLNLFVAGYDRDGRALSGKMFEVDLDSAGTVVEKQLEASNEDYFKAFLFDDRLVPIIDFATSEK
ncbi:MAG: endo-1,4-beta-xylanase [Clostridia bacterium]|nr:endo-1,4-beta-xylanase [Clostridia bacterium]